jgi:hypothetical protein
MRHWAHRVLADAENRERWLSARAQVITASDVANIMGIGDRSRASVLREKLSPSTGPDLIGDLAMVAAGRHLERGLFEWFSAETVHAHAHMCGVLIHSDSFPYLAATPDALLDGEPVECKIVGYGSRPNWHADTCLESLPGRDFLPVPVATNERRPPENLRTAARDVGTPRGDFRDHYRACQDLIRTFGEPVAPLKYWTQLQVQMHVLDVDYGWLVSDHAGTSRLDLYYARDRDFEADMLRDVAAFWAEWKSESTARVALRNDGATGIVI